MRKGILVWGMMVGMVVTLGAKEGYGVSQPISSPSQNGYGSILLDTSVYHYAKSDLGDLRVETVEGEEVPYYIVRKTQPTTEVERLTMIGKQNGFFEKKDWTYWDYNFEEHAKSAYQDLVATGMKLTITGENFAKPVQLLGSYDGVKWQSVLEGTLYEVPEGKQDTLYFPQEEKYTIYRIGIQNWENTLQLEQAELFQETAQTRGAEVEEVSLDFTVKEEGKETVLTVLNPNHLRFDAMRLEPEELKAKKLFKRQINFKEQGYAIYYAPFKEVATQNTTLELDAIRQDEQFEIRVLNGDSKPLSFKEGSIHISILTDKLVFNTEEGKNYRLCYGNEEAEKPSYDIEAFKNNVEKEYQEKLYLGEAVVSETFKKQHDKEKKIIEDTKYTKIIFNSSMVGVAIILILILLRALADKKRK